MIIRQHRQKDRANIIRHSAVDQRYHREQVRRKRFFRALKQCLDQITFSVIAVIDHRIFLQHGKTLCLFPFFLLRGDHPFSRHRLQRSRRSRPFRHSRRCRCTRSNRSRRNCGRRSHRSRRSCRRCRSHLPCQSCRRCRSHLSCRNGRHRRNHTIRFLKFFHRTVADTLYLLQMAVRIIQRTAFQTLDKNHILPVVRLNIKQHRLPGIRALHNDKSITTLPRHRLPLPKQISFHYSGFYSHIQLPTAVHHCHS